MHVNDGGIFTPQALPTIVAGLRKQIITYVCFSRRFGSPHDRKVNRALHRRFCRAHARLFRPRSERPACPQFSSPASSLRPS